MSDSARFRTTGDANWATGQRDTWATGQPGDGQLDDGTTG